MIYMFTGFLLFLRYLFVLKWGCVCRRVISFNLVCVQLMLMLKVNVCLKCLQKAKSPNKMSKGWNNRMIQRALEKVFTGPLGSENPRSDPRLEWVRVQNFHECRDESYISVFGSRVIKKNAFSEWT